jgi:hypothetical protein
MKKVLLLCCAILALTAASANAQGKLAFNDCLISGPGDTDWAPACTKNSGAAYYVMVASMVTPAGLTHVTGESATLELGFGVPVPAWWGTTCRAANQFAVGFGGGAFTCFDYFNQASLGGVVSSSTYVVGPDPATGDPNGPIDATKVRLRTVEAVNFDKALLVAPPAVSSEFFLFSLTVTNANTTTCTGCKEPACVVLKNVKLTQTSGNNYEYTATPTDVGNYATIYGGATVDCPRATPTNRSSWGQLKSLYR